MSQETNRGAFELSADPSSEVTQLLAQWSAGDASARERLIPLVYEELRTLARRCLARRPAQTLQSTALVHEAYLRMVRQDALQVENRGHFFALAARVMRAVLVDHARSRGAAKRGANPLTVVFDDAMALSGKPGVDLVALDDALKALAAIDARQSQIVELRFFGGLSVEETAQVMNVSPATIKREWATARLWLHHELHHSES
jgi:RNA polymerase sigma factor (TIGR02999 family)